MLIDMFAGDAKGFREEYVDKETVEVILIFMLTASCIINYVWWFVLFV